MTYAEIWIIDRFEGDAVVVERETGARLHVPRALVPAGVREGDVIAVRMEGEGDERRCTLRIDAGATAARARRIAELAPHRSGDDGGDLVL